MDFASLLNQFSSSDDAARQEAENQLATMMNQNFPLFTTNILEILVNTSCDGRIRQMAGILMKRAISSLSGDILVEKQNMWRTMDEGTRFNIRQALFNCLNDPCAPVRGAAASAISAIALIELPMGIWDNIFSDLDGIIQSPGASCEYRTACVMTIRYICEDFGTKEFSNEMTSAVIITILHCLQSNQPASVWKEAIQALNNILNHAAAFMSSHDQCQMVLEAVYNCLKYEDFEVREAGYLCFTTIINLFYPILPEFFSPFFSVCQEAIMGTNSELSIQACFTIAQVANVEAARLRQGESIFGLCQQVAQQLVSVLCQVMTTQSEDDDIEIMTVPVAAATCLGAFAEVLGNDAVSFMYPFINSNLTSNNWHLKEAAVMTFGCLLQGTDPSYASEMITSSCPVLLSMLTQETNIAVKDSVAWVLSQICENYLSVVPNELTNTLIETLINTLSTESRIAQHAALALGYIFDFLASRQSDSLLVPYFHILLDKLMLCADATGAANDQLRENAASALISLILCNVPETEQILVNFYSYVLQRCQQTLNIQQGNKELIYNQQRFFCIVLVTLLERLKGIHQIDAGSIVNLTHTILTSDNTSAHSHAILLYDAVVTSMGVGTIQDLNSMLPFVIKGICESNDISSCRNAIVCLSDILMSIDENITGTPHRKNYFAQVRVYRDDLIKMIFNNLKSSMTPDEIKPDLFSMLSSLYWELSDFMVVHVEETLTISYNFADISQYDTTTEEDQEWMLRMLEAVTELWDSTSAIIPFYKNIIQQGFYQMVNFMSGYAASDFCSPNLIKNCVLTIRDIGTGLDPQICIQLLQDNNVQMIFNRCRSFGGEMEQVAVENWNAILTSSRGNSWN